MLFDNKKNKADSEGKEKPLMPQEKGEMIEDEAAKMKRELAEEKKKSEDYLNNWKRVMADFQNYKKRQNELFAELVNSANQELILEILPIYDTFSLAIKHIPEEIKNKDWVKGMTQIKSQMDDFLKNNGLAEIKSIGEKFNPEIHEAVEMIESDKPEGEILEEVQKGYKLNGAVIRTAKVKVAREK